MEVREEESGREYPVVPNRLAGSTGGRPADRAREELRACLFWNAESRPPYEARGQTLDGCGEKRVMRRCSEQTVVYG
jgi:hypothetical protein